MLLELIMQWWLYSLQGKWEGSSSCITILDPLFGEPFIKVAEVQEADVKVYNIHVRFHFLFLLLYIHTGCSILICDVVSLFYAF